MFSVEEGEVLEVLERRTGREVLLVKVGGREEKAINYPSLTGSVKRGDPLLLNTTALQLGLGSGGFHFVMSNLFSKEKELLGEGHIMKLRYTPQQIRVHTVEEKWPELFSISSLEGLKVIVAPLHSHLLPLTLALREFGPDNLYITYLMTEGGSLPLSFSDTVASLKEKELLQQSITCGHSFGGDLEVINIYTGLLAAKKLCPTSVLLVTMGPGHVGTASTLGFSGVELAPVLDAVSLLKGDPFFVPRLSFADTRKRHYGISHHTITLLSYLVQKKVTVIFPLFPKEKGEILKRCLHRTSIPKKHRVIFIPLQDMGEVMEKYGYSFQTMGRGAEETPEFFLAPFLTGYHVARSFKGGNRDGGDG